MSSPALDASLFDQLTDSIAVYDLDGGVVYVNVHTNLFPGGEIRGQLSFTPTEGE